VLKDKPIRKAVMFCLMDASGSMGDKERELGKLFFILLNLFLEREYKSVDIRFIIHTTDAAEVSETAFFHTKLTGGTLVHTAFLLANEIIDQEYPLDEWNVYVAYVSDGDYWYEETEILVKVILETLERVQYCVFGQAHPIDAYERDLYALFEKHLSEEKNFAFGDMSSKEAVYPLLRRMFSL
jgi:uncharacterized sporulation protein YeaH/YhbH (DUF444 family)